MKLALTAVACLCAFAASTAHAQDAPTAVDRLAAFGFPFEDGKPGVGRVSLGDRFDLYVLEDQYAIVNHTTGKVLRAGALSFDIVDDSTIQMTLNASFDRIEFTFTSADVSDSGLYADSAQIRNSNGAVTAMAPQWYDFEHVHAELVDGEIIPISTDVSKKECRCACPNGTSNATGCTPDMCRWQNPCTGDPCAAPAEPADPAEPVEMALVVASGTCKWMDPCPPDCGSRELGLALLAAAGVGAAFLRRSSFNA